MTTARAFAVLRSIPPPTARLERASLAQADLGGSLAGVAGLASAPFSALTAALFRPCSSSMMGTVVNRKGMPMISKLSHSRSDTSTSLWGTEPLMDETSRWADPENDNLPSIRPSRRKRALRALARFLITLCIGVAATLAWQSYGDAAREMIAKSSPQLGWLAPQAAAVQTPPNMVASAGPSPQQQQQLKAMSFGIATMRQSVDQLAAAQNQMTNEITKLRAAQQEILDKISMPSLRPAAAPTHKPVPPAPSSPQPVR